VYLDGQAHREHSTDRSQRVGPAATGCGWNVNGYRPYDRMIDVASGQRLRITDIASWSASP